jgi:hypothetical protein
MDRVTAQFGMPDATSYLFNFISYAAHGFQGRHLHDKVLDFDEFRLARPGGISQVPSELTYLWIMEGLNELFWLIVRGHPIRVS